MPAAGARPGIVTFPSPQLYGGWQEWASALLRILGQQFTLYANVRPLPTFLVAELPKPSPGGILVFVANESGGPTIAYSDGSTWRRAYDNAPVS